MRKLHEPCHRVGYVTCYLLIPLGIVLAGCGGRDVTGPVPVAKMSTDKVSYEHKPGPGLKRFDFGELVMTEKLQPVEVPIPHNLDRNTEIIVKGTLRWPRQAGKIRIMQLQFLEPELGSDVILYEGLAMVKEKDGLHYFETELMKTPVDFVGKCKVRLLAHTIPIDYDPSSGILPEESSVVVGVAEVEMR